MCLPQGSGERDASNPRIRCRGYVWPKDQVHGMDLAQGSGANDGQVRFKAVSGPRIRCKG